MLASYLGTQILDGFLLNQDVKAMDFKITGIYLGLLTTLPQNNEQAYADGSYFKEPEDDSYQRICLTTAHPFDNQVYMEDADTEIITADDGSEVLSTYVTNQSAIMFPESSKDWGTIEGFGIFKEKSGGELPIVWGPITGLDGESDVVVNEYEVPIIRVGQFKVSMV